MENLEKELKEYKPFNEQEKRDKELILQWLQNGDKIFTRENKVAHITVSAWIVNANRDKVLMVIKPRIRYKLRLLRIWIRI